MAAPRNRDLKRTLCRTCYEPVDPRFSEERRAWDFMDAGTETPHRCPA